MRARDIMHTDFVCVRADMPLREAAEIMLQEHARVLPVIHEQCGCHSVLTEVDVLRAVLPSYLDTVPSVGFLPDECALINLGKPLDEITVLDLDVGDRLHMVAEDTKLLNIAHTMLVKGVSTVGVERDGEIVGIIRRSDLIRYYFRQLTCEEA